MKQVTHVEFYLFIKNYPNKLALDRVGFSEPATLQYNDFSGGKIWLDSVVASVALYEEHPHIDSHYREIDNHYYTWKPNQYFIMEEK